jgi:hypothetical protein
LVVFENLCFLLIATARIQQSFAICQKSPLSDRNQTIVLLKH